MEEDDDKDPTDEGLCDAYLFLSSYHVEQKRDLKLGEQYAAKCVEYLPTREHGTRLLNVIKDGMVQSSSPQKGSLSLENVFNRPIRRFSRHVGATGSCWRGIYCGKP